MWRGRLHVLCIFLLLAVCCVDAAVKNFQTQTDEPDEEESKALVLSDACSPSLTRAARESLEENMYAITDAEDYHIPISCPFHQDNDKLRSTEKSKRQRRNAWKCQICKKTFKEEAILDVHIKLKHPETVDQTATVCLADYCDILGCNDYLSEPVIAACNPIQMDKRKFECETLMTKCFPPGESDVAFKLNSLFIQEFCEPLACNAKPRGGPKWTLRGKVFWWLAACLVGAGLFLFYVLYYAFSREHRLSQDLKRLSTRRHASMSPLRVFRSKVKGY